MKILIVTMDCGECHNMIAKSLYQSLHLTDEVKVVDLYEKSKHGDYGKSYLFATKYIPRIFTFSWNLLRKVNPDHRYRGLAMSGVKNAVAGMEEEIRSFQPDVVFCTHNYAAATFCYLKIHNRYRGKIYAILCDFCVCPYWQACVLCDGVFTPHEMTHAEMIRRGFREEQLHAFGFPIHEKFEKHIPRREARLGLGIADDEYLILSLNGGMGVGDNVKLIKNILKTNPNGYQLRIMIVCGKNEREYRRVHAFVAKRGYKNITVLGFVDNVNEIMTAADLVFNRGGCGILSESLVCGVPTIAVREYSVAQETLNAYALAAAGRCVKMKKVSDARKIVEDGIQKARLLNGESVSTDFVQTESVKKIIEFIHKNAEGGGTPN